MVVRVQFHPPLGGEADHRESRIGVGLFAASPRRAFIASVIGGSPVSGLRRQPEPDRQPPMAAHREDGHLLQPDEKRSAGGSALSSYATRGDVTFSRQ